MPFCTEFSITIVHYRLLLLGYLCTHNVTFLIVQLNLLTKVFEANSEVTCFANFWRTQKIWLSRCLENGGPIFPSRKYVNRKSACIDEYCCGSHVKKKKNWSLLKIIVIQKLIAHTVLLPLCVCLIPEAG